MEGTGRNKGLVGTPFLTLLRSTPLLRRTVVSLPFQVHRLKLLVEAGLVAVSSACFEFADEVLEAQHGSLAHLPKKKTAIFTAFRRLLLLRTTGGPVPADSLQ